MTECVHKKLGDCCESELGKTLDEGRNTGLYRPYLCALNVLWGKIDLSTIKQMRIEDVERERYLVKKGDLLVCEGGEIGRCAIWENDDEIYYQNALHRVRFYKEYDAYFFMYLLCHYNDLKLIEQYGKGLTIKHLNQAAFRSIPVCVPSLPAQRRIAAIFSSADKVIVSTQKVIAKYKQMKQGLMEDLLKPKEGWKMVRLGEVGEINPSNKGPIPNQFIYIDLESVIAGKLLFENYILKGNAPSRAQRLVDKNDVLYQTVRPYQRNNYIHKKQGNYVASTGYALIRCHDDYEPDFIFYLLHTHNFESVVLGLCTGTSYPAIAPNNLKRIEIAIPFKNGKPDLAEQRRIAAILSGIDAKIAAEERVLEKYEKVKKGLMERLLKANN